MKTENELLDLLRKNAGAITYLENTETGEPYKRDDTIYIFLDTQSVISFLMKLPDVKMYRLKTIEGIHRKQLEALKELAYKVNVNDSELFDVEDKIEIDDTPSDGVHKANPFETMEKPRIPAPVVSKEEVTLENKETIFEAKEEPMKLPETKAEAVKFVLPKEPVILEFKQELSDAEKIAETLKGLKDNTVIYLVKCNDVPFGYYTDAEKAKAQVLKSTSEANYTLEEEGNLFLAYYTSQFETNGDSMVLGCKDIPLNEIKASLNDIGLGIQKHFEESCVSENKIKEVTQKGLNFWYDTKTKSVIRMVGTNDFALFDDENKMDAFATEYIEESRINDSQKAHIAPEKAKIFYEKELKDTKYVFFNGEQHCAAFNFLKIQEK